MALTTGERSVDLVIAVTIYFCLWLVQFRGFPVPRDAFEVTVKDGDDRQFLWVCHCHRCRIPANVAVRAVGRGARWEAQIETGANDRFVLATPVPGHAMSPGLALRAGRRWAQTM